MAAHRSRDARGAHWFIWRLGRLERCRLGSLTPYGGAEQAALVARTRRRRRRQVTREPRASIDARSRQRQVRITLELVPLLQRAAHPFTVPLGSLPLLGRPSSLALHLLN